MGKSSFDVLALSGIDSSLDNIIFPLMAALLRWKHSIKSVDRTSTSSAVAFKRALDPGYMSPPASPSLPPGERYVEKEENFGNELGLGSGVGIGLRSNRFPATVAAGGALGVPGRWELGDRL